MAKRYFKSTDGTVTIFRATTNPNGFAYGLFNGGGYGFSNTLRVGARPAVEITEAEYASLTHAKHRRWYAEGSFHRGATGPQSSWVRNADLSADYRALYAADAADPLEDFNYVGSRHHY